MARARSVGSTFLEAIAAVGLASLRSRVGRIGAALAGYREVIDHWAAGGNWSHQWVTLRNLADLLRTLDDAGTADLLDAAADRAPDAARRPAGGGVASRRSGRPDREQALALARTAIARHLAGRDSAVHARLTVARPSLDGVPPRRRPETAMSAPTTTRPVRTPDDVTALGTVLGVWAHPDDELYLSGGVLAAAAAAGQRVVVVTATRGEHGTDDPARWPPARLAAERSREITASLAALDPPGAARAPLPR